MVGRHSVARAESGGFSLIEMLVATTVFSFGMGGMAALMLSAAGGMAEAEHQSQAHLHAAAMAAILQLSPASLEHLAIPPQSAPLCFEDDSCSAEEWLAGQYSLWRASVARHLPNGQGLACLDSTPEDGNTADPQCDGAEPAVVKVLWEETRHAHDTDGGARRSVLQVPR